MKHTILFTCLIALLASCTKSKDDTKHDYRCTTNVTGSYEYHEGGSLTGRIFYDDYRYDTLRNVDTAYVQKWVKLPGNYYEGDSTVPYPSTDTTVFYYRNTECRRL